MLMMFLELAGRNVYEFFYYVKNLNLFYFQICLPELVNFEVLTLKRRIKVKTRLLSGFPCRNFHALALEPSVEGKEYDSKPLYAYPTT